jgi:hypothetical protein
MLTRSVMGGALATVGVGALLSPVLLYVVLIASLVAVLDRWLNTSPSLAVLVFAVVPWLVAVALSSLLGGYFAGAIAGRQRARHGAAAALAGLTAMLVIGLGFDLVNAQLVGQIVAIGAITAIPVAIVGGRLGAMLAPRSVLAPAAVVAAAPRPRVTPVVLPAQRLLPATGQKGGQRMDDDQRVPPLP